MLTLNPELLAKMHAHLQAGYPHEACGILIGDASVRADGTANMVAKDAIIVPNSWEVESEREGLRNRFLISPDDYVRADREAGKRGLDVIGFFHSHPDCPARPSETDREFAMPRSSFVIVSVEKGNATSTHSWVLRDDRSGFNEEDVMVV
jgi:proteasome lid subunit RPN8/RPN11